MIMSLKQISDHSIAVNKSWQDLWIVLTYGDSENTPTMIPHEFLAGLLCVLVPQLTEALKATGTVLLKSGALNEWNARRNLYDSMVDILNLLQELETKGSESAAELSRNDFTASFNDIKTRFRKWIENFNAHVSQALEVVPEEEAVVESAEETKVIERVDETETTSDTVLSKEPAVREPPAVTSLPPADVDADETVDSVLDNEVSMLSVERYSSPRRNKNAKKRQSMMPSKRAIAAKNNDDDFEIDLYRSSITTKIVPQQDEDSVVIHYTTDDEDEDTRVQEATQSSADVTPQTPKSQIIDIPKLSRSPEADDVHRRPSTRSSELHRELDSLIKYEELLSSYEFSGSQSTTKTNLEKELPPPPVAKDSIYGGNFDYKKYMATSNNGSRSYRNHAAPKSKQYASSNNPKKYSTPGRETKDAFAKFPFKVAAKMSSFVSKLKSSLINQDDGPQVQIGLPTEVVHVGHIGKRESSGLLVFQNVPKEFEQVSH